MKRGERIASEEQIFARMKGNSDEKVVPWSEVTTTDFMVQPEGYEIIVDGDRQVVIFRKTK